MEVHESPEMEVHESPEMEDDLAEFTLAEIMEMQNLYKEMGKKSLTREFFQELAASFSCSSYRSGKSSIKWEQVQSWFEDKQNELACKAVESSSLVILDTSTNAITTHNATKSSQKTKGERVAELSELVFEAISAKDEAWFDVASFLNYRVVSTGELEVRVRFAGFGNDEDEWVNVKSGVRERSIPLEASECHRIKVGDLVLCYRSSDDHALYSDAHILEIQRRLHDIRGCRCIFVVRYAYDDAEAKVPLSSICCRP